MKQLLIALDQLFNTLLGGMADETLSARAWRCYLQDRWPYWIWLGIDTIFFWQPAHCYHSWLAEFEREHLPSIYKL